MNASAEVERLLANYPAQVAEIARAVRETVQAALPGCAEEADDAVKVIGYGYGPGYAAPVYGGGDCAIHYRRAWDGYRWVRERVRECY